MNKNKITKFVGGVMAGLILAQSVAFAAKEININEVVEDINISTNQIKDPVIEIPDCDIRYEGYKEGHPIFDMGKSAAAKADEYIEAGRVQDAIRTMQDIRYCVPFFANQGHRALLPYIKGVGNINYISKPNLNESIEVPEIPLTPDAARELVISERIYNMKLRYYKAIVMEDFNAAIANWTNYFTEKNTAWAALGGNLEVSRTICDESDKKIKDFFQKNFLYKNVGARQKLLYSCGWQENQAAIVDLLTSEIQSDLLKIQAVHISFTVAQGLAEFIPCVGSAVTFALMAADRLAVTEMAKRSEAIKILAQLAANSENPEIQQNRIDYIRYNLSLMLDWLGHIEKHYVEDIQKAIMNDKTLSPSGRLLMSEVLMIEPLLKTDNEIFIKLAKVMTRIGALTQTTSTLQQENWGKTYSFSQLPAEMQYSIFLRAKFALEDTQNLEHVTRSIKLYDSLIDNRLISWDDRENITRENIAKFLKK